MAILQEIKVPQESVNDQTLLVLEIFFKTGDKVKPGTIIAELETSKTAVTVEAVKEGFVQYFCKAGDELEINALIARILDEVPAIDEIAVNTAAKNVLSDKEENLTAGETVFSKNALELMEINGIEKEKFRGQGFVGRREVELLLNTSFEKKGLLKMQNTKGVPAEPVINDDTKVILKKISSYKKKEIAYLSSVQSAGLVSVINIAIETGGVSAYLNRYMKYFRNNLLPVIIYEVSRILKKFPELNSYYTEGHIAYYNDIKVGFAADMGKGLKVLGIREANKKSIQLIEEEIFQLSGNYLDDKIKPEELSDITFTITDLSAENIFSFSPLINMKNAAILGISAIDEKFGRCMLSMAFDHRVTEGRNVAVFLDELKSRIESYNSSAMEEGYKSSVLNTYTCHKCYKPLAGDLSDTGFIKCITPEGKDGYICQSCLKGF